MITKEDGSRVENSNSYATLVEVESYLEASFETEDFDLLPDEDKEKLIIASARILDTQFKWRGCKTSTDQAMEWPRFGVRGVNSDDIPAQLIAAQGEIAKALATSGSFQIRPAGSEGADQLKEISLGKGALKIGFQDATDSGPESNEDKTVVSAYVRTMLRAFGSFGHSGSRMVKVSRG